MRVTLYFCIILLFLGCSNTSLPLQTLQDELINIGVETKEAKELALKSKLYAQHLHKSFEADTNPWFHNFLVNIGVKEQGLCYEYAYAMFQHIKKLPHSSYNIIVTKANNDSYFEHTAVAICPPHIDWQECIILDAWRDSKNLFYVKIKDDKYKWQKR